MATVRAKKQMSDQYATGPAALVLAAAVARRYYLEGATKVEIAAQLGLSRFKVARLLEEARARGIVRIELDSPDGVDLDLSVRLGETYGLRHSIVMDGPEDDDGLLRATLGRAAGELVSEIVEPGDVLGLAWARALMPMRISIERLARCDVVQLTGALALPDDESPIELVRDVARRSRGRAYFYYAPMILSDVATAKALRTQPEVARALDRFGDVTKAVVGVGAWQKGLSTVADALSDEERREIYDLGVRSEMSGVQLDAAGTPVTTKLSARLIGIDAEHLRRVPEVIAIVYGPPKADAVHAALHSGLVTSIVTHPTMARELLARA
jgi:DNA-binding transcriptional regulator LsrR (DeoR family)